MANALQEQLLKAGLANKQKIKDVKTQKKRNRKAKLDDGKSDLKAQIAAEKQAQQQRDKALNQERFSEAQERGQVRALISEVKAQSLAIPPIAEIKFNYSLTNKIHTIYIDEKLKNQLAKGQLGIARIDEVSYLIPHKLAERINLLVPQWCGYLWQPNQENPQQTNEDDPYADYVIPDDLMW